MKNKTKISAIIPTYNGLTLLKKNLPAVLDSLRDGDELIIMDDASNDSSFKWLQTEFGLRVKLLEHNKKFKKKLDGHEGRYQSGKKTVKISLYINNSNCRFGESVNRGVKLASNSLVFVLNNDVSPKKDVIDAILPHFEDVTVFGVGCMENEVVVDKNGKKKTVKSGKNKLWFEKGIFFTSRADDFKTGETAWISGGSGVFDRSKWLELGGFDKKYYPAYWEDIDLSFRARKHGWKVIFEAGAVVNHNHESTNLSAFGQEKINKMSWNNADKFTWGNGHFWQRIAFILWRGYWWWKRSSQKASR